MSNPILWSNFFQKKEHRVLLDILKQIPIFEELNKPELKALERILHRRIYREGEYVFHAGDLGVGMYIIEEGEVSILADKTEREIALLHEGEFFGELALLIEERRTAHAIARTDTKVFGFFQPDLFSLLERKPRLGVSVVMKLAKVIARRMQMTIDENQILLDRIASFEGAE